MFETEVGLFVYGSLDINLVNLTGSVRRGLAKVTTWQKHKHNITVATRNMSHCFHHRRDLTLNEIFTTVTPYPQPKQTQHNNNNTHTVVVAVVSADASVVVAVVLVVSVVVVWVVSVVVVVVVAGFKVAYDIKVLRLEAPTVPYATPSPPTPPLPGATSKPPVVCENIKK